MVEKHQILRTSFDVKTYGQPVQFVHPSFKTSVAYVDLSSQTEAEIESYIQQWLHNDRAKPFEISFGNPLWRLMVLRYNETDLDIIMSCHHAIVDGWSYASLMTELSNTYQQLKSQPNYRPKSLLSTYKDYVLRQQWVKESAEINAFWKSELAGFNRLSLPFKNNSDDRAFCGSYMDGNLGNLVLTYAKANKISPRVVYFSAYAYLMKLMSYESDLVVGLVEHGRPSVPDADKLVACFLNTIPVRIDFTKVDSWQSYVMMVDKKLRELKQYGELPLAEIAKNAGLANQQNPLFDTHFTYVDFHVTQDNDQDLVANSQHSANNFVKTNTYFDFIVSASYNQLGVGIQFADALFSKDEANQLIKVYTAILTELVSNQEQALFPPTVLAQFPSFSSELNAISPTPAELPHLAEALASQLKAYTNHIAISENGQDYSYEALNQRSDVIACHLIAMGVKAQDNILLLLPNSFEAVATILACIKSNIVYVPVDVDYPHARIAYMAADAEVKAIVSQSLITAAFDSFLCPVVLLDELSTTAHTPLPPVERNNSDLAYILYTSGSTGKPKGAMITQQGLFNYCQWAAETYVGEDKACFPLYSSLAFDLTVTSVFVPLLTGNRMAVYHSSRKEALIQDIINDKQATIIKLTPAHLQVLNELDVSDSTITKIIVGGEALKAHLAQSITTKFGNKVAIFNEYGPTETTVGCSIYLHDYQTDKQNSIPIGVPIKNTALSIVDNRQHAMLKGCLGEILIGGDGVAEGI